MSAFIINRGDSQFNLILNFLRGSLIKYLFKLFFHEFLGLFSRFRRKDIFFSEPFVKSSIRDIDIKILFNDFTEMNKIGIRIIVNIGRNDQILHIKRESGRRTSTAITVNKSSLTIFFIFEYKSVNSSKRTAKFNGSAFLVAIRFNKFFNNFIFF